MPILVDTQTVSDSETAGEMLLLSMVDTKYLLHVCSKLIGLVDYIRGNLSSIMRDKSIAKYSLRPDNPKISV